MQDWITLLLDKYTSKKHLIFFKWLKDKDHRW